MQRIKRELRDAKQKTYVYVCGAGFTIHKWHIMQFSKIPPTHPQTHTRRWHGNIFHAAILEASHESLHYEANEPFKNAQICQHGGYMKKEGGGREKKDEKVCRRGEGKMRGLTRQDERRDCRWAVFRSHLKSHSAYSTDWQIEWWLCVNG